MISQESDIPTRCQKCPAVLQFRADLCELRDEKDNFLGHAKDDSASQLVETAKKLGDMLGIESPAEDELEEQKAFVRKVLAQLLDEKDAQIETMYNIIDVFTTSCIGSLTLRASQESVTYSVTICRNTAAQDLGRNTQSIEPANVERLFTD